MVRIRLIGVLRGLAGFSEIGFEIENPLSVENLLRAFLDKNGSKLLSDAIIDLGSGDPRPNLLVLVNDREISALDGLQTVVSRGDEVVLVPVAHGG